MKTRCLIFALALACLAPAVADVEVFHRFKSTANWALIDADGLSAPASLDAEKAGIRCGYQRGRDTQFRYTLPLKEFQKLEIEVMSHQAITLELLLTDESGVRYRYEAPLEAGDWETVTVRPGDLAAVGRSQSLDPAKVVNEILLAETAKPEDAAPRGETPENATPMDETPEGAVPEDETARNTLTIRKIRVEKPDQD